MSFNIDADKWLREWARVGQCSASRQLLDDLLHLLDDGSHQLPHAHLAAWCCTTSKTDLICHEQYVGFTPNRHTQVYIMD